MKVVFHADDFGLTPGVNAGIVEAHRRGVLGSTSLMATAEACDDAVALARATPRLDIGVHLTLVEVQPSLPPAEFPSLVRDGTFLPTHGSVGLRYLTRRWRPEEARRELAAQLESASSLTAQPPTGPSISLPSLLPSGFEPDAMDGNRRPGFVIIAERPERGEQRRHIDRLFGGIFSERTATMKAQHPAAQIIIEFEPATA